MINPADWTYLLIGALLAGATQGARIYSAETVPLLRIALSSCFMAAVAAFSLCGCLVIWMKVPPLASMFLSGVVGFAGGDWVLSAMAKQAAERYGKRYPERKS